MTASRHLDRVITRHEQIANLQVVFVDVEKYSKRRTQAQVGVIRSFTQSLEDALTDVSKRYVSYSQTNDINLRDDTIVIPTGDGAAIGFSFDGLHDIHLNFALDLLRRAHELRSSDRCDKFEQNGWCHCHPYFNLRVGIADGRAIIYKDVNGNYNLAGTVVNYAARIMGMVDRNQVAFTSDAFRQIVDMVDDAALADRFREYPGITVKHGSVFPSINIWTQMLSA